MKFSRNDKTDVMITEPFQLQIVNACPTNYIAKNDKPIPPSITGFLSLLYNYKYLLTIDWS